MLTCCIYVDVDEAFNVLAFHHHIGLQLVHIQALIFTCGQVILVAFVVVHVVY